MPTFCSDHRNIRGEKVFMAVTTEETQHITKMVSQQKRTKKGSKVINYTFEVLCLVSGRLGSILQPIMCLLCVFCLPLW